jgi:hypothetical protein
MNPHASLPVADTSAPFEHFAKNGYYIVNNQVYLHKIRALQEATRTNSSVRWYFNDPEYCAVDWSKPLGIPLLEIYKLRAQQLRNKYKYLILAFSGGGDSTTILESFLDNGILFDEIIFNRSSHAERNYVPDPTSTDPANFMSEWDYVVKPKLEWVAANYPRVKITIVDHELSMNEYAPDTATVSIWPSFISVNRARGIDHLLRQRQDEYGDVAMVMGIAPPNLTIINKDVFVDFPDAFTTSIFKSDRPDGTWSRNVEFFYWTPDFPEIVREQAHALMASLKAFPNTQRFYKCLVQDAAGKIKIKWPENAEAQRLHIKKIIYPNYPLDILQVNKMPDMLNKPLWSAWFFTNPQSEEYLHAWRSAILSEYALIDRKFFVYPEQLKDTKHVILDEGMPIYYVTMPSRFYKIGSLMPAH